MEIEAVFAAEDRHRQALDGAIGVLAAYRGLGEREEDGLRMHQAAEPIEIGAHHFGIF
jgi:hypothetical protein